MLFDPLKNIEARETGVYGKSLFAKRGFKKDEIVFVANGAIVSKQTNYTIPIDWGLFIEPRIPEGNICQYICHSCEPNLGIKGRTLFVAMRDIKPGEEVTIDYAMIGYEYGAELPENERMCKCGRATCRGNLGCYKELPEDLRVKYRGYISDYLLIKSGKHTSI
ncbi:MAG TPA: SET domain-containing protein-lysine N-methyltransferase [Spirochaetota bacterium]